MECFIGKVKRYRRVFTRFEKLSRRYLEFWHFGRPSFDIQQSSRLVASGDVRRYILISLDRA